MNEFKIVDELRSNNVIITTANSLTEAQDIKIKCREGKFTDMLNGEYGAFCPTIIPLKKIGKNENCMNVKAGR